MKITSNYSTAVTSYFSEVTTPNTACHYSECGLLRVVLLFLD